MKVLSAYPVIVKGGNGRRGRNSRRKFSNASGDKPKVDPEKIKAGLEKSKEYVDTAASLADTLKGIFRRDKSPAYTQPQYIEPTPAPKQGMSNTTKIALGVGGAIVLLTVVYLITKKK